MAHERPIRVLCVDDLPDVAAVMQLMLDAEPDMTCVGCLASADDLVSQARRLTPDILVLDASMPGKDPFKAMTELRQACPDVAAIVYSGRDDPDSVDLAAEAGAWGWVGKHEPPHELVRAVREVAAGHTFFPTGKGTH
jgi:DNA-binding NarL/FixJ family response regulator